MIIKNGRVAIPGENEFRELDISVSNGIIKAIGNNLEDVEVEEIIDATGLMILPGGIDPHVHFNDPGFTEREDFYHGSAAAASGGITTVIDMPCTSIPPVISLENFQMKEKVIAEKSVVDYGLYGGISKQAFDSFFPDNVRELAEYVMGFKVYFISGMPSFERLDHHRFERVMKLSSELGIRILLHAEDFDYISDATKFEKSKGKSPLNFYRSRPEIAEIIAVQNAVEIAESMGGNLHIVHVSAAKSAEIIARSNVTCETAPHYLEFSYEDFEKLGSSLKTTPVVKSSENKVKLWQLLADGKIDFIASDHAPCPTKDKNTDSFWNDYSGIPGTGTILPYIFSEGYAEGRISLSRMLEIIAEKAAKKYKIWQKKGSIELNKDADFVIINPGMDTIIQGEKFFSKGKVTPFEGMKFKGKIVKTVIRGKIVYDCNKGIVAEPGYGKLLKPNR